MELFLISFLCVKSDITTTTVRDVVMMYCKKRCMENLPWFECQVQPMPV